MKKGYSWFIAAIVAGSTFGSTYQVSAQQDAYKIASTCYDEPLTQIDTYIGKQRIKATRYAVGNMDMLHDGLLYSGDGKKVINLKNSKATIKSVEPVSRRIIRYKNAYYELSLSGDDSFKFGLTKYTLDFKKIGKTKRFNGLGNDMVIVNDKLYVLTEETIKGDYTYQLQTFNTKSFTRLHRETLSQFSYAGYIYLAGSKIKIYGESTNRQRLGVLSYDIKKQRVVGMTTTNRLVMGGAEKVQPLSEETELVFNQDEILEINYRTKKIRTLYDSPDDLVDYTYDKKTKTYRVLEQVIRPTAFRVKILDRNFKEIRMYPLKEEGNLRPFRVF